MKVSPALLSFIFVSFATGAVAAPPESRGRKESEGAAKEPTTTGRKSTAASQKKEEEADGGSGRKGGASGPTKGGAQKKVGAIDEDEGAEPRAESGGGSAKKAGSKEGAKNTEVEGEAATTKKKNVESTGTSQPAKKSETGEGSAKSSDAKKAHHGSDVPEASVAATPKETAPATPPAHPGGTGAPPAFIEASELKAFSDQPEKVRKLIENALALSHQGLTYKFGSDDPSTGGMDCSGSIAYLLRTEGFKDVPRDASGQYAWARKEGNFFAVVSKKAGGFEFDDLQPGDLLFWSGTYAVDRDPPVTHTMIYLGEHKSRKQRVMWGSSDGRTYDGKARFGVGVFDFKMPKAGGESEGTSAAGRSPDFLGYARIPGLRGEESKVATPDMVKKDEEPPSKRAGTESAGSDEAAPGATRESKSESPSTAAKAGKKRQGSSSKRRSE